LYDLPGNEKNDKVSKRQKIYIGTSCGCSLSRITYNQALWRDIQHLNAFHSERYTMMTTDFYRKLIDNDTIEELMLQAAAFSYRIPNWKSLCIALCEDWTFDFSEPTQFRKYGYSDKMLAALEKPGLLENAVFCEHSLNTSDIIPESSKQKSPAVYLLTSLHSSGQIFGYICTSYDKPDDIYLDENYCGWCDTLSNGIQEVQRKMYHNYIRKEFDAHFDIDPETRFLSQKGLVKRLSDFIEKNGNCAMIFMQVDDQKENYPFDPISLIASAVQKTGQNHEIVSRVNRCVFAVIFPFDGDEIDSGTILQRTDQIENHILQYETYSLPFHITLPYISFSAVKITEYTVTDIEAVIDHQLSILNRRLNLLKNDPNNCWRKFYEFRQNIKRNLRDNKLSIDDAAKRLGFSKSHFQRIYMQVFGRSFSDDMIRMKLDKAKYLLSETDMKITAISRLCGYENESHFMRQFRDKVGMTAMQFRKKHGGNIV